MTNRYKGYAYPIEATTGGLLTSGSDIAQIKASMLQIIRTRPGERVMNPNFGTPLHTLVDKEPEYIIDNARLMIARALKFWEKRVQVTDVQVILIPASRGYDINVTVLFLDPVNMQEDYDLTVQFPLE